MYRSCAYVCVDTLTYVNGVRSYHEQQRPRLPGILVFAYSIFPCNMRVYVLLLVYMHIPVLPLIGSAVIACEDRPHFGADKNKNEVC
jgi:hypothetical protein